MDDDRAITQLLATYASTMDREEHEAWVDLFAEDGRYLVFGRELRGRDRLLKMATSAPPGVHMGGLPVIDLDGDRAEVKQGFVFVDRVTHEMRIGWYDDVVVRQGDRWRFESRRCTFATPDGPSDSP